MSEEQRGRPSIGEGLRAGIGILTAFKEAIEETIDEAAARNDLRPERAKEALTGALSRAQGAFDDVRERLEGGGPARLLDAGAGPPPAGSEPAG